MMRMRAIVLAFSCAASSLMLAAPSSTPAFPQEQEQRAVDTKETSSDAEVNKVPSTKKISSGLEAEPFERSYRGFSGLGKRFLEDQEQILASPAKIRFSDAQWLVPLSGVTAGLFVTDASYSRHLSQNPTTISHYKTLSDAGVGALIGGAAGMWLLGHVKHNEHWSETGFLAGEAALNSLVTVESLKYSLRRERPFQGNGTGSFFQNSGTSFPSEHAAAAWSVAGVIAHEYPSPFMKIMAYGLASLVDYSRVRARQHFPSDVFVGSIMGNLIAQNVYSRHHDPGLGGEAWSSISHVFRDDGNSSPANQGSPYVPLDSWVYPALDRLMALGVIDSGFAGLRPWTRSECARLLNEAQEKLGDGADSKAEAGKLLFALEREFHPEFETTGSGDNTSFKVESVYTRVENISGAPLTDGYHFGQTEINDFGRPYGQGWNSVTGISTYATSGRWVGYVRGELQTAPSIPALPVSARQFVAAGDGIPSLPPSTASPSVQRFQLLDAYAGLTFSNWEVSFGRQSLDWGPGEGGALILSDNAAPINMFRINRVSPLLLPSFLKFLGPLRMEFFVGQLAGHHFVITPSGITGSWTQPLSPQPFTEGEKVSFKPSRDLEVGLSYTTIFGGTGVPATLGNFVNSLLDKGGDLPGGSSKSSRFTGLDFSYRIPKLRKWLTLYGDGFTHDQIIFFIDPKARPLPFGYPERAVWRAGIYVPRFPKLSKLDFRAEGGYTDSPQGGMYSRGFFYAANRYLNGDTNNGNVLGSWMGRAGQGEQAWTNYWFNARNRLQFFFRHQKVSQEFVPGGGSLTDAGVRTDYSLRSDLSLSVSVKHELWLFPVIQPNASRNVTAAVQILFEPHKLFQHSAANAPGATSRAGDQP
jgi:membrane-associated phospholipid phosphatase